MSPRKTEECTGQPRKWQYFSSHPEVGADQLADRIDGSQLVACSAVGLPAVAPKIPLERSLRESKDSIASLL
jgi:hypothetical protein